MTAVAPASRQRPLPLARTARIAWRGMRARWWRSALVAAGIVLAVAFLAFTLWSEAIATQAPLRGSPDVLERMRRDGTLALALDADARLQTRWMVGLALLIALVGILNATAMSVAERTREIGTMKCLGALDGFIVRLFLIESAFQGGAGALVGLVVGVALAYAQAVASYGLEALGYVALATSVRLGALVVASGLALALAGAFYPAWAAARLRPVEAMRIEV